MRLISANLNKRLGKHIIARYVARWLASQKCDLFVSQEPWTKNRNDAVELNDFRSVGGNSSIHSWIRCQYALPLLTEHCANWHELDLGYLTLHNIYLSPYSSAERTESLHALLKKIKTSDKPQLVVGDFNMAPETVDGIAGGRPSTWTSNDERVAFNDLLSRGKILDVSLNACETRREYTIERVRNAQGIKFRCDLALATDYVAPALQVKYDHSTRTGPTAFTDHSAVIVDIPLTLAQSDLFSLAGDAPLPIQSDHIKSHKTAMARSTPSKIATELKTSGLLDRLNITSVLDFGCGRGRDVSFYRSIGLSANGYDPYAGFGFTALPNGTYDLVTVVFVLNVLPDPWERLKVLHQATELIKKGGFILVATRSIWTIEREAKAKGWEPFNDGYFSHKGKRTFQKGLDARELNQMLNRLGLLLVQDYDISFGKDVSYVLARKS